MVEGLVAELKSSKEFFDRSTRCLKEENSDYRPVEGMFSVAGQMAHVAQTIDWFLEGAFGTGFDLDFEKHSKAVSSVGSVNDARKWIEESFARAIALLESKSAEELAHPMPEGPIMGGMPRLTVVGAMVEHTAHHRGALTVYSRTLGHVPPMPYVETEGA